MPSRRLRPAIVGPLAVLLLLLLVGAGFYARSGASGRD